MEYIFREVKLPAWPILVLILILIILIIYILASAIWPDFISYEVLKTIFSGVISGLFVSLVNFAAYIFLFKKNNEFKRTGFIALRDDRYDEDYYSPVLKKAKYHVDVTGTSCSRFIQTFFDKEAKQHILLDMMKENKMLRIRLLVPDSNHMSEQDRKNFAAGKKYLDAALEDYPEQLQIRYFKQHAMHSFVLTDNEFIGGPIFLDYQSKNSPALHLTASTDYANKHKSYFEILWENGSENFQH